MESSAHVRTNPLCSRDMFKLNRRFPEEARVRKYEREEESPFSLPPSLSLSLSEFFYLVAIIIFGQREGSLIIDYLYRQT